MERNIKLTKKKLMKVPTRERRRFIRHPLVFPLRYSIMGKGMKVIKEESHSKTINISLGGLMFAAKHPVKNNAVIQLKMPFEDRIFSVKARVVHCTKSLDTNLYNVGVCFYRINDAFKVKLIEQLYLISEYRDLRSIQLGREISLEDASKEWIKRYSERFRRLYW